VDGALHTIWAYGIDDNFGGHQGNPRLTNSPQKIICSATQPDLSVTNLQTQGTLVAGQTLGLQGRVQNTGTGSAPTSDTVFRIDGTPIGTPQATGPLVIGGGIDQSVPWPAIEGPHTLQVCADSANVIAEASETNNCGLLPFTVSPAPTPTPSPPPTPTPLPGIPPPTFREVP